MPEKLYSDLEEWRRVPGFPNYEVSSHGRVRRASGRGCGTRVGHILKPVPLPKGYLQVYLRKDGRTHSAYVHRLVAQAFLGPATPGQEVNHRDADKSNNHASNLEWVGHRRNMEHAREMGILPHRMSAKGEAHARAKLTEADIREIFRLRTAGWTQVRLAERFGVAQPVISAILLRKRWTHVKPA